jgi:hypothetical protein
VSTKAGELQIFVFHMPVYVLVKKVIYSIGLSKSYAGLALMTFSGVVFPLIIGRILSINAFIYRLFFFHRPPMNAKTTRIGAY